MNPPPDSSNPPKSPSRSPSRNSRQSGVDSLSEEKFQECLKFIKRTISQESGRQLSKPLKKQPPVEFVYGIESFFKDIQKQSKPIVQEETEYESQSQLYRLMLQLEGVEIADRKKADPETLAHTALLSSLILKVATDAADPTQHSNNQLKEDSVRNRIFGEIINYPQQLTLSDSSKWSPKAIKQAKKNIFQLFSSGVYVPAAYLHKENEYQCVQLQKIPLDQQVQLSWETWSEFRKVRFHISQSVTCRVFKLLQSPVRQQLLLGQQAIGKSFAVLLLKILVQKILRLKFEILVNQYSFTPYKNLVDRIQFGIPKIVVISFTGINSASEIKPLVKNQIYQLTQSQMHNGFDYMKFDYYQEKISSLYYEKMNVQIVLVIDKVAKLLQKTVQDSSELNSIRFKNNYHDCIANFVPHFRRLKIISSQNIEQKNREICFQQEKFKISTQSIGSLKAIHPQDTTDLILFYLEQKLIHNKTLSIQDDTNLKLTRSYILESLSSQSYAMISPSVITAYFSQSKKLYECRWLLQNFLYKSELRLVERVISFINAKNSRFVSQRYQIILKIMEVVSKIIEKQQNQIITGLFEGQFNGNLFQNQLAGSSFQNQLTGDLFQKLLTQEVYFHISQIELFQTQTISQLVATNLLNFIQIGDIFECKINPVLLIKILKHAQKIIHSSDQKSNQIIFQYAKRPDIIGRMFQAISIDILLNAQTNLSFCLYNGSNLNSQKQTISFNSIDRQSYCFFSIPAKHQKRLNNYRFLQSFQIVLNQTKGEILNHSTVFMPMYQPSVNALINFTRYKNYGMKISLINSKFIDAILCTFTNNTFYIMCLDFTSSQEQKIREKMRQFLKGFLLNEDKHETMIQFTDQNDQKRHIKVEVSYFVWTLIPNAKFSFKELLESEAKNYGLNIIDKSNHCEISFQNKRWSLLKKMGILSNNQMTISCQIDPQGIRVKKELIQRLKNNLERYNAEKQQYCDKMCSILRQPSSNLSEL